MPSSAMSYCSKRERRKKEKLQGTFCSHSRVLKFPTAEKDGAEAGFEPTTFVTGVSNATIMLALSYLSGWHTALYLSAETATTM